MVLPEARSSNVAFKRPDGTVVLTDLSVAAVDIEGHPMLLVMGRDVTCLRRLEDALQRAQRMEAIGQLTGGIAHDFNNLLAAILANAHFLLQALPEGDTRRVDAEEINAAAERAAALTRQLLAFSRRQVLEPKTINLNAAIVGVEKMLRRLICEDIELTTTLQADLRCVHLDQGQLEQVIVNLVVNARDAMPRGGRLCLETANVEFLEPHVHGEVAVPAGRYVMLAVSDSGVGMNEETKQRLFEPFFTTKEVGRGTGLGLSTCYGIVKQSGGFIWVYSELDRGTEFRIYLPASNQPAESPRALQASQNHDGSETVLLIEDDDRVRSSVARILRGRGYQVLATRNGAEAEAVAAAHVRPIHVVISDVVMPGMSGPDVVARLRERSAIGKALFMSGYAEHSALANGVLSSELQFIQKPFAPDALARKLREVLDR
jgi:signal transduction histidine kinase/ActR/RegA family two-component response regulator